MRPDPIYFRAQSDLALFVSQDLQKLNEFMHRQSRQVRATN